MGNQLDREYEVEAELTRSDATGGLNGGWKIFRAKKKSSGEDVSLWIFDKKVLKGLPKTTRHRYYALLRQEFTVLARLIHPNVLRVLQPISETKRGFMVETEPVFASLANLLGDHTNLRPSPELKNTTLDPFDVKMGVLEITEALAFLHGNANMIHRNVCPHSILLTTKGSWKLAGFAFAVPEKDKDKNQLHLEDDGPSTFRQAPSLDYVAPETVLTAQQGFKMDMWSLGMTLWEATTGKPALVSVASQQMKGPRIEAMRDYKLAIGQFFPLRSGMLQRRGTEGLPEVMEQLLCREPGQRADAQYFLRSDYFNDTLILTLMYLNDQNILQKDPASKAKFFKGLPHVLSKFSHRVVMQKVLPAIISELRNHELLPFVLPSLFQIVREHLSSQEFCKQVLPCLLPLMALEKPLKSSILLLSELETILKKAGAANIKSHILPMLVRGLEHSHPKMQEEVLKQIPKVVGILDFNFVKSLLPRLQALNLSTRLSPIRARIIICLEELVPHLDKSTIQDVVVPTLQECVQQERTAVVIMRVMVVFDLCSTRLGEQFTAINILPFAFPLCVEPSLNAEQFKFIIEQIKNMVQRVENTQLKKLPRTEQDAGSIMTPSGPRSSFSQEEPEREEFPQGQTNFTPPTSTSAMVTSPIKEVIGADFKDIITNVSKLSTQAQTRATAFISSLSSAPAASSTSVSSSSSSSSPALPSSSGPSSSASPNLPSSSTSSSPALPSTYQAPAVQPSSSRAPASPMMLSSSSAGSPLTVQHSTVPSSPSPTSLASTTIPAPYSLSASSRSGVVSSSSLLDGFTPSTVAKPSSQGTNSLAAPTPLMNSRQEQPQQNQTNGQKDDQWDNLFTFPASPSGPSSNGFSSSGVASFSSSSSSSKGIGILPSSSTFTLSSFPTTTISPSAPTPSWDPFSPFATTSPPSSTPSSTPTPTPASRSFNLDSLL